MKHWMIWMLLLLCLTGCARQEHQNSVEAETKSKALPWAGYEADYSLQGDLARWYNLNLRQEYEPGFRACYNSILFFEDGVLAMLEIPGVGMMPVYHGVSVESEVGHMPDSAFPVGEAGDHAVLTVPDWELETGDIFYIRILDTVHAYRVMAVRSTVDASRVPGMALCSLVTDTGVQYLGNRIETEEIAGSN